jgi:hypothetical protein
VVVTSVASSEVLSSAGAFSTSEGTAVSAELSEPESCELPFLLLHAEPDSASASADANAIIFLYILSIPFYINNIVPHFPKYCKKNRETALANNLEIS